MTNLDALLDELHVGEPYRPLLERLLACTGSRAGDALQEFAVTLLQAREEGRPEPEALGLAACRRWLRRERLDDAVLAPLSLTDDSGKERERPLQALPCPIPAARRQIRWGRRAQHASMPVAPDADLRGAVRALPLPERRAIQACFGIVGPRRRGRRSREVLRLAERGLAHLREVLRPEHFAVNLF
jgi:hypothetical protein